MKVFISWSGDLSHKVATSLRDWLPNVVQTLIPYVSSEDIDKGTRWSQDIAGELSDSFFGILCVTTDNIEAPWLNFEAGALSKSMDSSNVCPFLINIKRADVKGPILQFQSTILEKEDIRKLVYSLNKTDKESRLDEPRLREIYDVWWPKLESKLKDLIKDDHSTESSIVMKRSDDKSERNTEILEEILEISRQNTRSISITDKILTDFIEQNRRYYDRQSEFRHPVFGDLRIRWLELRKTLTGLLIAGEAPTELRKQVDALGTVIDYISERSAVRGRSFRNISFRNIERKLEEE